MKGLSLKIDDTARAALTERGYDPAFGARPLKRVIQRDLGNPLAMLLLEGRYSDGDDVLVTLGTDGEFCFS